MGIDLGFIFIDFTPLLIAAAKSPFHGMWFLFVNGGWLPILIALLWGGKELWMFKIQNKYASKWNWVLLSLNIPKENEQTPKAVENIFSQIAGAHTVPNFIEKYFKGKIQEVFSFEIAANEGHISFYIKTTEQYRDLVEAAIYGQYPDAEIFETNDYTEFAPDVFPSDEYNLWGTEFILTNKQPYPIRTHPEFEDRLAQEFKDPMAAMLEALGKLRQGEHIWLQIIIQPISDEWRTEGFKLAKKLVGAKVEEQATAAEKMLGVPIKVIEEIFPETLGASAEQSQADSKWTTLMQFLTPGERKAVEAIQFKISKIGFNVKFRMLYFAKKEVFHKGRGVAPIIGAVKQFNTLNLNGFKPAKEVTTRVSYFFVKQRTAWRQRKLMKAYKGRSLTRGTNPYVLNIEELASIFHFPARIIKAPLTHKTETKRAEPPTGLPFI